jgi:hypothetical protein
MKILNDESLPIELKNEFKDLEVFTVNDMKWLGKKNGELLTLAVDKDFDVFIIVVKNLKYQLNIKKYKISIIVLDIVRTKQEFIKPLIKNIRDLFSKIKPYEIHVVNAISNE